MGDRHFYKCPSCGEWITNAFDEKLQEVGQVRCHLCNRLFQLKTTLTEIPEEKKAIIYHGRPWVGAKYIMNDGRKVREESEPGYQVLVGSEIFNVEIEQDEDGYIVDCPSLPGCHTQGDTIDEAIKNIKELIQLHLGVRATTPYVPMKTIVVTVDFTISVPNWVDPEEVFTMFDHGVLKFVTGKGKRIPSVDGVFYQDIASADGVICHETTGARREVNPEDDEFQCERCGHIFDIDDSRAIEGELFCVGCFKEEKR